MKRINAHCRKFEKIQKRIRKITLNSSNPKIITSSCHTCVCVSVFLPICHLSIYLSIYLSIIYLTHPYILTFWQFSVIYSISNPGMHVWS